MGNLSLCSHLLLKPSVGVVLKDVGGGTSKFFSWMRNEQEMQQTQISLMFCLINDICLNDNDT